MPQAHHPRRGSLGYSPRCRARSLIPRITTWPIDVGEGKKLPGFAGYKVGTTHIMVIENKKTSPLRGQERRFLATIIETPPLVIVGYRAYSRTTGKGLRVAGEVWSESLPRDLQKKRKLGGKKNENKNSPAKATPAPFKADPEKLEKIELIVATQPHLAGFGKKTPDIFEMPALGKSVEEQLEHAKSVLGSEVKISDVVAAGDYMDVFAITKGKGFQGPVKRWGVKLQPPKTKNAVRRPGNIGGWTPKRTLWCTPMGGQMGCQQRCEYNKRVYSIGAGGIECLGGWKHYGLVNGEYVIIKGSVAGANKRLLKLRFAVRCKNHETTEVQEIVHTHMIIGKEAVKKEE